MQSLCDIRLPAVLGLLLGRQLDDFYGIISIDTNDNLALECHLNVASNCSSQFIGQFTVRVAVSSLRLRLHLRLRLPTYSHNISNAS